MFRNAELNPVLGKRANAWITKYAHLPTHRRNFFGASVMFQGRITTGSSMGYSGGRATKGCASNFGE